MASALLVHRTLSPVGTENVALLVIVTQVTGLIALINMLRATVIQVDRSLWSWL